MKTGPGDEAATEEEEEEEAASSREDELLWRMRNKPEQMLTGAV